MCFRRILYKKMCCSFPNEEKLFAAKPSAKSNNNNNNEAVKSGQQWAFFVVHNEFEGKSSYQRQSHESDKVSPLRLVSSFVEPTQFLSQQGYKEMLKEKLLTQIACTQVFFVLIINLGILYVYLWNETI